MQAIRKSFLPQNHIILTFSPLKYMVPHAHRLFDFRGKYKLANAAVMFAGGPLLA